MNSQNSKNTDFNTEKPHIFDPSVEVKSILKFPSNERKLALENFYKNLEKYHADLVGVFDFARTEFGDLDLSDKTNEEIDTEIEKFLKKFGEKIQNFDENAKNKILEWIAKYAENKKNAYKKLKEFEENPLKFLQENGFEWESLDEIQGKIEVDEYRGNVVIYVDKLDRRLFAMSPWEKESRGVFSRKSQSIVVVRYKNIYDTFIHENQHSENYNAFMYDELRDAYENLLWAIEVFKAVCLDMPYLNMTDFDARIREKEDEILAKLFMKRAIIYLKDEILAQMRGGEDWKRACGSLSMGYDFLSDFKYQKPSLYQKLRDEYLEIMWKYVYEAERLVKNGVSLDALAITPIEKWWRLLKNSLQNSEKLQENFVFENVENLDNWHFSARKIYENGEIWEGIFDENKKFLEGKKILNNEIQEWKFFDKNNKKRGQDNENLTQGWNAYYYGDGPDKIHITNVGDFFQPGSPIKNGVALAEGRIFLIQDADIRWKWMLRSWDRQENIFDARVVNGSESRTKEDGVFTLKNGNLLLQDGIIVLRRSLIDFYSEKHQWFQKVDTSKLWARVDNFFPFEIVKIYIKDGKIMLDDDKIREIDDFLRKNRHENFEYTLERYQYNVVKNLHSIKDRFSEIVFP